MTTKNLTIATLALSMTLVACGSDLGPGEFEVPLTYLDGESNYGPEDATGVAFINSETGLVTIEVVGLPTLTGELYEGWLAGSLTTPLSTGTFNTDGNGEGMSRIEVGNIVEDNFSKVVITVEPDPDPDAAPDSRHSLAGEIPKE